MALLAAGTCVGFVEKSYDFEGRKGVSRRLTVSTGDSTEEISINQDMADQLGSEDLGKLAQFGRPVVCKVKAQANSNDKGQAKLGVSLVDIRFVRLSDLEPYGYSASVYVEEPVTLSAVRNGSAVEAGV